MKTLPWSLESRHTNTSKDCNTYIRLQVKKIYRTILCHKQIGNQAGEGTTLNNIGEVYRSLGEYNKALDYYQQALAIIKQVG